MVLFQGRFYSCSDKSKLTEYECRSVNVIIYFQNPVHQYLFHIKKHKYCKRITFGGVFFLAHLAVDIPPPFQVHP